MVSVLHWTLVSPGFHLPCLLLPLRVPPIRNQGPEQENDSFNVWSWLRPDSATGCDTRLCLSLVVSLCLPLISQLCW